MIIAFVGTPGSGKSYEAVLKILENLKLGRKIYTNIDGLDQPEKKEAIKSYCNLTDFQVETLLNYLDDDQVTNFWDHCQKGSLIVLDEIHKWFSNREWATDKNVQFTKWASTHRHEGFDLILVTQDIEKVDKHCRSLVEWTYLFRKINQLGASVTNRYIAFSFIGDQTRKELSKNIRKYDPKVFPCYSSYVAQDVKELGIMSHVNILKHPAIIAAPIAFVISIYMFLGSGFAEGNFLPGMKTVKEMSKNGIDLESEKDVRQDVRQEGKVVRNVVRNDVRQEKESGLSTRAARIIEYGRGDNPIDVVTKWRLPGGKIIYTNNWTQPEKAVFLGRL